MTIKILTMDYTDSHMRQIMHIFIYGRYINHLITNDHYFIPDEDNNYTTIDDIFIKLG